MAFLVSVVELEGRLNRDLGLDDHYSKPPPGEKLPRDRPKSLRGLLTLASQARLITITQREIDTLTEGRNRIAHGRELPSDALQDLTELVLRLLDQLPEQ
jgi:hypothetical protein